MQVVLFRSSETPGSAQGDDNFLRVLEKAQFSVKCVPVLAFEFCALETLRRQLQTPANYHGLILTSPRSVESLKLAVASEKDSSGSKNGWESELREQWSSKYLFCVGPSTAQQAVKFFGVLGADCPGKTLKIIQSEHGNADSLGREIIKVAEKETFNFPLLYPCGELRTDTISSILTEGRIPFESIIVYRTTKNPDLENSISKLQNSSTKDKDKTTSAKGEEVYVFFSPSGVRFSWPFLQNTSAKHIIAIGPTTKESLEAMGLVNKEKLFQCDTPTPQGLLEILDKIKKK